MPDRRTGRLLKVIERFCFRFVVIAVLLAPLVVNGQTQRFNIITEDNDRPGFGDLVSNWYAALFLRAQQQEVNFYLSPEMQVNFSRLEPNFDSERNRQMIRGIQVFAHANDIPENDTQRMLRLNEFRDMLTPTIARENVCNLSFTARSDQLLRPGPVANRPNLGSSALAYKLLGQSALLGAKGIPLIGIETTDTGDGNWRLYTDQTSRKTDVIDVMAPTTEPLQPLRPFYFMRSTFSNKHLAITRGDNPITTPQALEPGYQFQGFAHESSGQYALARGREILREYLDNVGQLAGAWINSNFLVVITATPENFPITKPEKPIGKQYTTDVDGAPGVGQGHQPFREYQYQPNMTVRQYANAIPFRQVDAYIAASNLPILVTGTMSLSQAIQHVKPFYYETHGHQGGLGVSVARAFIGENENLWRMLIPVSWIARDLIAANDTTKQPNLVSRRLFLLNPDPTIFESNYEAVAYRIHHYRVSLEPSQLLDNLSRYCDLTRKNYLEMRQQCARLEGVPRQECAAKVLNQLKPEIDTL